MADPQVTRDDFFDSLLGDFLDESTQLLDRLNENLLQMDEWVRSLGDEHGQRCDAELLNDMFRSAHSLKGLSAMLGLKDINNLTHRVENVFDAARKDQLFITGDVVELMFQAVDRLVNLVEALKDHDAEQVECESVVEGIQRLLQAVGAERAQSSQADAERALAPPSSTSDLPPAQEDSPPSAPAAPAAPPAHSPGAPRTAAPSPAPSGISVFEGLRDEAEISDKYLSIFLDEAELSLDELTETLLALEGGGNRETIEKLLITSHRIKGSAASVGLNRAAKLAHLMEDLLQNLFATRGTLSPGLTDALLKCTDALRQYVDGLRKGGGRSDYFSDAAHELVAAQDAEGAKRNAAGPITPQTAPKPAAPGSLSSQAAPQPSSASTGAAEAASPASTGSVPGSLRSVVARLAPEGGNTLLGEVTFRPALPLVGLKARLIYEKLFNLGDVCYFDPPPERIEELEELDKVSFGVTTEKTLETVYRHLRVAGVDQVALERLSPASPQPLSDGDGSPATEPAAFDGGLEAVEGARAGNSASRDAGPQGVLRDASRAGTPKTHGGQGAPRPAGGQQRADASASEPALAAKGEPDARGGTTAPGKGRTGDASGKPTETLRVDIERLDQLMNLAGELVISKAQFSRIADRLKTAVASRQSSQALNNMVGMLDRLAAGGAAGAAEKVEVELESLRAQARRTQADLEALRRDVASLADVRGAMNDLFEAVHQLDRVSDGIQRSVMDTRMVPIGPLFSRFKRVVRDITRVNGKLIRLVIKGEKTELDKRMIDELGDPLIHMVRNSADHGVEAPEVREAAGKPPEGTITLNAFHRGNSIVIQVSDDGKGLDAERILRKAIEKGLVNPADADKLTPQQIYNLIWEPGLSTAEKVTEVSGRGMGMDIVKSKIEDLNGSVDLDSAPGQGTTMTIKLPLTLAILPSLMVEIDGDVFAMPIESVVEIVGVSAKDLTTIHGLWTAQVRGRVISVVRLGELLRWNALSTATANDPQSGETTLVVVGERGHEIGLAVNRVLGEEDVVIKSMAENYRNVAGIAGASILGDGRVSLILDVAALIEMASHKNPAAANA